MVALSASAVASIYAAGFIMTRSADAGLGAVTGTVPPAAVVATATAQPAGTTVVRRRVGVSFRGQHVNSGRIVGTSQCCGRYCVCVQGRHLYQVRARVGGAA